MGPVVQELQKHPHQIKPVVCVTAQHRQMLNQVLTLFGIEPDINLALMEDDQIPSSLTARGMTALTKALVQVRPDLVLVQGDTTTAMVAALAAFYHKIPVGHIEAGLRTRNRYCPFPEEINRHLIGVLATYHFAPTATAANALRAEGIRDDGIFVTGNTVIDALLWTVSCPPSGQTQALFNRLGIEKLRKGANDLHASNPRAAGDGPRLIEEKTSDCLSRASALRCARSPAVTGKRDSSIRCI